MDIFLLIVWVVRTLGSIAESTYYWQLKEYRWDRMREFLLKQGGHQLFFKSYQVLLVVLLVFYFFFTFLPGNDGWFSTFFPSFVGIVFLAESIQFLHQLLIRHLKRPRLTLKAVLILMLTVIFLALPLLFTVPSIIPQGDLQTLTLLLLVLALLDHDFNAAAVLFLNAISSFIKKAIYRRARKKRLSRPDLIVIGITGSFGKTSVKEFLSHILSAQFSVLKTEKNTNTEMGIARTILKKLEPSTQVFVCEMGAYAQGEITLCCFMAHPKIGIFTGLNDQHLALFGSLENTFKAKWELFSSLPGDGIAVVNGDSHELEKRLLPLRCKSIVCSTHTGNYRAEKILVKSDRLAFTYQGQRFTAPLTGGFQIINLLMSVVVAEQLGMSLEDIARQVKTVESPEKTMNLLPFARGYVIDDSYNVNQDGLKAALSHLDLFQDHLKILIFPGILELGEETSLRHEEFGEYISHHVDYAVFTDPHFSDDLSRGALKAGLTRDHLFLVSDQSNIFGVIHDLLKKHEGVPTVLLFESRGAAVAMEKIIKEFS